jgi:glucose/arabinose dehydrogenase
MASIAEEIVMLARTRHVAWVTTLLGTLALSTGAQPQGQQAPQPFTVPSSDPGAPPVAQSGPQADAIRESLRRIRLPPGFRIELYAVVPGARHLALSPDSGVLFVGTRQSTVWAVITREGQRVVDQVRPFAPGLRFRLPNGVCRTRDGGLVVVELNRVLRFPAADRFLERPDITAIPVVAQGDLVPTDEESPNHGARTCRVSPEGRLYITLGQPYNVQPRGKVAMYERLGIGGIIAMNAMDGSAREVVAVGVRNSVGLDIHPTNGRLWFTDNQTDRMGDDTPPGELNRVTRSGGEHFGYPFVHGKDVQIAGTAVAPDLKGLPPPAQWTRPQVEFPAHQAQLGMSFYTGTMFPPPYRGGIFVAAHGSWNRRQPTGALINFVPIQPDGSAGPSQVFAEGWLDENGSYRGRPVDVAPLKDGSLLISDDLAGALYRVTYSAP